MRVRLQGPRRVAAGTIVLRGVPRSRQAVRIALCDEAGHCGWGEALPLPGYSRDDADTAHAALTELADAVARVQPQAPAQRPGNEGLHGISAWIKPFEPLLARSPSARFAIECAWVDLLARRAACSAAAWLAAGRALQPVPVSVLLPDEASAAAEAAAAAARRGHRVLKLKVARADRTAAQEDQLLRRVRAAADEAATDAVALRLDANGGMDAGQLAQQLTRWAAYGVELVEEPLAGPALLNLPPLPLPWAADESLADPVLAAALLALPPGRAPAALVLKPAELGLLRCLTLAESAVARGVAIVVTHSLDGDLGHAAACALAQALPAPPWPCGLAAHAGLHQRGDPGPWLATPTTPGLGLLF